MQNYATAEQLVWESTCSEAISSDTLWKLDAYRAALYFLHVARGDCRALAASRPDERVVAQLLEAAGSVSANLAEGYSRATRADRLRMVGYALGSVRECVAWYETARGALADEVVDERLLLVSRLRALILGLLRALRADGPAGRFEP